MKVSVSQFYLKPSAWFPFSVHMQRWLSEELSSLVAPSPQFQRKYGHDFELVVNIGADKQISDNQLKGPAVFKKTKTVEYSVFLPYDVITKNPEGCRAALEFLLTGIRVVFQKAGIDPTKLDERKTFIVDHICSDPVMLEGPWPHG